MAGGTLKTLNGGKFGHGFVSAGLNKVLSPLASTDSLAANGAINVAIGGTVSEITGGDFANGAVMAAMQYAFNALADSEQFFDDTECRTMGCSNKALVSAGDAVGKGWSLVGDLVEDAYLGTITGAGAGAMLAMGAKRLRALDRVREMVRLGHAGEDIVGSLYDIGAKFSFKGASGKSRRVDGFNKGLSTLSEVKNRASQGWTRQLKDYSAHAQSNGLTFNLYVDQATVLSSRVNVAASAGKVNVIRVKMR